MARVVEWRPDLKNGGSPLGSIYVEGEWKGYMGHGEVLSYAEGDRVKVTGKLAHYARKVLRIGKRYLK